MTRVLKTSGFLGLVVMMVVGLHMSTVAAGGGGVPSWMIGGHAHLGVLSILAIVLGFTVTAFSLSATLERVVTWTFVLGQWGLPLTVWIAVGADMPFLHPTTLLWGSLLVVSMAIMTWQAATTADVAAAVGDASAAPGDD